MPRFERFCAAGRRWALRSTVPPITPAAWGAFQTGLPPGRLGVVDFLYWDRTQRRLRPFSAQQLPATLWERASRAGRRVVVINVPLSWPPRPVCGALISGMPIPGRDQPFTHPPELGARLRERVPGYDVLGLGEHMTVDRRDRGAVLAFVDAMVAQMQGQVDAACWLFPEERPDLAMVHLHAIDFVQHRLWGYLDRTHPAFEPKLYAAIADRLFPALDAMIALLDERFRAVSDDGAASIILSDHGFQANRWRFNLGRWLLDHELVAARPVPGPAAARRGGRHPGRGGWREAAVARVVALDRWGMRRLLPGAMRRRAVGDLRRAQMEIDPARSRVYAHGVHWVSLYFLSPELGAPARRAELASALGQVRHRGAPVVAAVHWGDDLFAADVRELAPDALLEPAAEYSIGCVPNRWLPLVSEVTCDAPFWGIHHPDGILAVSAADVPPPPCRGDGAPHLEDLTPWVLELLDIHD